MKKFFITTPIYYASGLPHIGNAYASIIADIYARYKRLLGYKVKFSTGLDENGQKMIEKAESTGKNIWEFLDDIEKGSKEIRQALDISYTDFIRTTQEDHKLFVQSILNKVHQQDQQKNKDEKDFYKAKYKGLYCTACEGFKRERDLILNEKWEKICPDHLTKPKEIIENNRFFNLTKYEKFLKDFYQENQDFVVPKHRFIEIKKILKEWLWNFSISRENWKFGIPIPFDDNQITYIRYDALFNYLTVCQQNEEDFRDGDSQVIHVLAKDIAKFHAIYRPAMLQSAGYRQPNQEIITGYFTVDGQKMSKTIWNVIDPKKLIQEYNRDHIVFYLFYDVAIGSDWDFSWTRFKEMYNSMLIGWRGNLINRVTKLSQKYEITEAKYDETRFNSIISNISWDENKLTTLIKEFNQDLFENTYLQSANIKILLQDRYQLVQSANEYITIQEPRKKYKNKDTKQEAIADLQFLLRLSKNLALIISPITIKGFSKIQSIFWNPQISALSTDQSMNENQFIEAIDLKEFPVNLNPEIIYEKKED